MWNLIRKMHDENLRMEKIDYRHCVSEGDRVHVLKGHGQALEQKQGFPGIFSDGCDARLRNDLLYHTDGCDASANLLNEFDGQAVPRVC